MKSNVSLSHLSCNTTVGVTGDRTSTSPSPDERFSDSFHRPPDLISPYPKLRFYYIWSKRPPYVVVCSGACVMDSRLSGSEAVNVYG
ncbi:unnamed protein product [Lactuca virosa]|uniref:Uncharacterized protein n=1 Tax=Lactuca virosa TaxID=75947 RepID=A0AAU9N940_9ASTR|nr:unnamed protein product [Lactuca virosa]